MIAPILIPDEKSLVTQKPRAITGPAPVRHDGWTNIVSSMGTNRDKSTHTRYTPDNTIPLDTLAAAYAGDGLCASIIDIFADDFTREWGTIENEPLDEDGQGVISTALEKLDAKGSVNLAKKWARLYGGALLIIGALDGNTPDKPLNIEAIKSIEYLKVLDVGDIILGNCKFNKDETSPEYGKIETYAVQYRINDEYIQRTIHASRCIPFFGKKAPMLRGGVGLRPEARYWGISELQAVWPALRAFQNAYGATSSVLNELSIGKFKFADLDEMLAEDGGKRFQARMQAINDMKSVINSVMMGTDEEFLRDTISLSGIPDVLDRYMMLLSAVTRYPVTKLFGRSPSGLNATGESDIKNYYDSVRAVQNADWPYIQKLVNMVASWKKIDVYCPFKWNPLFQLTDEEKANVDRIVAETYRTEADGDERYMNQGVLSAEEVYKLRFEKELGPKDPSEFEDMPETEPDPLDPNEQKEEDPKEDPKEEPKE